MTGPAGQEARATRPGGGEPGRPPQALRPARVLVVDDALPVARSTARLLELFGHTAGVATTAAEALRRAAEPWDLVLLDLGLPDADGRDVLRSLAVSHPALPVVVMSGEAAEVVAQDLPGVRFVSKPYALDLLLSVVEEATRVTPARR